MAQLKKKLSANVDGNFFVDSTCINCDTCRQLAQTVFAETPAEDFSYVAHQPETADEERSALRALLACPTSSIGTEEKSNAQAVMNDFPLLLEEDVYYCGFNSPKSFGANSYFVKHPDGNWLVDSPKFLPHLVKKFKEAGGIRYLFLTHRDDVAEAEKYAREFQCSRIIHRNDLGAQPSAEIVIEREAPQSISENFRVIPTPGHTQGHLTLLYRDQFLFTGDHFWWNPEKNHLGASKGACWYSWKEQIQSMIRLQDFSFEWVCPGHGSRVKLTREEMRLNLKRLIERMKMS